MYNISKELFEAVMGIKVDTEMFTVDNCYIKYHPTNNKEFRISRDTVLINDFFFKCIDFVNRKGYIFNFDSRGYSRIKHISTGDFKLWEDKEFNKQRLFDACQWVLGNKD